MSWSKTLRDWALGRRRGSRRRRARRRHGAASGCSTELPPSSSGACRTGAEQKARNVAPAAGGRAADGRGPRGCGAGAPWDAGSRRLRAPALVPTATGRGSSRTSSFCKGRARLIDLGRRSIKASGRSPCWRGCPGWSTRTWLGCAASTPAPTAASARARAATKAPQRSARRGLQPRDSSFSKPAKNSRLPFGPRIGDSRDPRSTRPSPTANNGFPRRPRGAAPGRARPSRLPTRPLPTSNCASPRR